MKHSSVFSVEFIRVMARHRIQALVIGRQAMAVYGAPTATNDLDLLVVSEHVERRLVHLAEDFDLVKVFEETGGILFRKKQTRYADDIAAPALTTPRVLDILTIPRLRGFSFETAWKRRVPVQLDKGITFFLPHVDDLIALKRARSYPRDKEDIAWLKRNRAGLMKGFPSVTER